MIATSLLKSLAFQVLTKRYKGVENREIGHFVEMFGSVTELVWLDIISQWYAITRCSNFTERIRI